MNLVKRVVAASTALASALLLSTPVLAASWADVGQLGRMVEATGTVLSKNTNDFDARCVDNQGYYTFNKSKDIDLLVICVDNLDTKDPDAIWEVLSHEAIHAAQYCYQGPLFKDEYLPRMWRTLKSDAPHYAKTLDGYPDLRRRLEMEAFYSELQPASFVMATFQHACFKD